VSARINFNWKKEKLDSQDRGKNQLGGGRRRSDVLSLPLLDVRKNKHRRLPAS
jgi:hypothetical protein